jgi:hypothetical protein
MTNAPPLRAPPYWASSWAGNRMAPQWQGPSLLACTRWAGPRVIISPARVSIPPHWAAGAPPMGNATRTVSVGTSTKATRGTSSSALTRRKL